MEERSFKVGVGSAEVTGPLLPVGMMGFAQASQRVEGIAMPLRARAFAFEASPSAPRFVFVSAELWGITQSVQLAVGERLRLEHPQLKVDESNVMLTATHTHSGPGGYSHHLLFNLSIGGYAEPIFQAIVDGVCSAIVEALEGLEPGRVYLNCAEMPANDDVAFNRAIEAYNANPDVCPVSPEEAHLAVDREMTSLRLDSASGEPLGALSWFGVHASSLHSDNTLIHPDNKGLASKAFEDHAKGQWQQEAFVAAFPQTSAGDVTPNFRWDAERGCMIGQSEDDMESARYNGELQFSQALKLHRSCSDEHLLGAQIKRAFRYVDFSAATVSPEFCEGRKGIRTGHAVIGISMAQGTAEGPGPLFRFKALSALMNAFIASYLKVRSMFQGREGVHSLFPQGAKFPMFEPGRGRQGRFLGLFSQATSVLFQCLDPTIARIHELRRRRAMGERSWTPPILPLQLVQVGALALVGLPFEPTTVAARRIKELIQERLAPKGVRHVVVSGYANAYCGYLTTQEEYALQGYEAASTYMGQWTLAATLTHLVEMSQEMSEAKFSDEGAYCASSSLRPMPFDDAELEKRRLSLT